MLPKNLGVLRYGTSLYLKEILYGFSIDQKFFLMYSLLLLCLSTCAAEFEALHRPQFLTMNARQLHI